MASQPNGKAPTRRVRKPTRTSAFGTSGRISHDSSAYYDRALQPNDAGLNPRPRPEQSIPAESLNQIFTHSSESMHELPDRSVHLMVTSPPYNVGKDYDDDLHIDDYLDLLKNVFAETYRVLEPGGRGRRFRSLLEQRAPHG